MQTSALKARYGTFTVYLVTAADVDAEVTDLLADSHTGQLGTRSAGGHLLGAGRDASTATRTGRRSAATARTSSLAWIGSTPVKKTDATWKRLHAALTAATK